MKKVRVCLVGTGRAGLIHARNLARRIPGAELAALCDSDAASLQKAAQELGVTRLFSDYRQAVVSPDIDAVVIVTPTFLHCEIACLAAQSEKHIFLEKPMAVSVRECAAINAAAAQARVKLQIGFMRRFDEGFLQAKEILASGEMGRVNLVKSTGRGPGGPGAWMYDLRKSNGIIAEVNSHDLDTLRWFVGSEPVNAYAIAGNFKSSDARRDFPDFYDVVSANFRFADGALGLVDGACPCHYGYDARVEILCENGVLFLGTAVQQGVTRVMRNGQVLGQAVKSWRNLFRDAYLAEMEHFIACVAEDLQPRVTGLDGQGALAMALAVNESVRSGAPVAISK